MHVNVSSFLASKMMHMNILANVSKSINYTKKQGKCQVLCKPCMFQGHCFLTEMMKHGYIVEFEIIDDHRAGKIVMNHTYRLNSFVMCT